MDKQTNKQWRLQRLFCVSDLDANNRKIWLRADAPMEVHMLLKSISNGNLPERIVNGAVAYSFSKAYNLSEVCSTFLSYQMIQRSDIEKTIKNLQAS